MYQKFTLMPFTNKLSELKKYISRDKARSIIFLSVFVVGIILILFQPKAKINTKEMITTYTEAKIISKEAVDELINKAAQQKYLQNVFNSKFPTLSNKHALQPLPLKPLNNTKLDVETIKPNKPLNEQRCTYANQSYVPGDIVKTEKGWIRCTPTLTFSSDKGEQQFGSRAWTMVQ